MVQHKKKLLLKPVCVVCVFCFTPRHSYRSLWRNISHALPALALLAFFLFLFFLLQTILCVHNLSLYVPAMVIRISITKYNMRIQN